MAARPEREPRARSATCGWPAGDRTGALAAYEESLAITRKLAATDPGNAQWQRDLVLGLWRSRRASIDPPRARDTLREALGDCREGSRSRASSRPRSRIGRSASATRSPSCRRRPPRRGEAQSANWPQQHLRLALLPRFVRRRWTRPVQVSVHIFDPERPPDFLFDHQADWVSERTCLSGSNTQRRGSGPSCYCPYCKSKMADQRGESAHPCW